MQKISADFGGDDLDTLEIAGTIGRCGAREVFLGFAPANLLVQASFADVLDDSTGQGYQRRFCRRHSIEFKRYIGAPGATTIPLTFNLRGQPQGRWELVKGPGPNQVALRLWKSAFPVMSQVDCQHRLGYLQDSQISFAFMAFLGLTVEEEISIFRDINGKAKGLSGSLIDLTEAKLAGESLQIANPYLAIALRLHEDPRSPWHKKLDLGGDKTCGTKRVASLRTMQNAVKRMVRRAPSSWQCHELEGAAINFWCAVVELLPDAWQNARSNLLTKGVGVYSLMSMAGVLCSEAENAGKRPDIDFFISKLSDFVDRVDWSNSGPLRGYGGVRGADEAFELMLRLRRSPALVAGSDIG